VPQLITGSMPSLEINMVSEVEAQTRANSSAMIAWVTMSAPAPPYSTGMPREGSSSSTQASKDLRGNTASRSAAAALGATLSSANLRRVSRNSRWVSVRANRGDSIRTSYSAVPTVHDSGQGPPR
jgi:hypothetical protein